MLLSVRRRTARLLETARRSNVFSRLGPPARVFGRVPRGRRPIARRTVPLDATPTETRRRRARCEKIRRLRDSARDLRRLALGRARSWTCTRAASTRRSATATAAMASRGDRVTSRSAALASAPSRSPARTRSISRLSRRFAPRERGFRFPSPRQRRHLPRDATRHPRRAAAGDAAAGDAAAGDADAPDGRTAAGTSSIEVPVRGVFAFVFVFVFVFVFSDRDGGAKIRRARVVSRRATRLPREDATTALLARRSLVVVPHGACPTPASRPPRRPRTRPPPPRASVARSKHRSARASSPARIQCRASAESARGEHARE